MDGSEREEGVEVGRRERGENEVRRERSGSRMNKYANDVQVLLHKSKYPPR